MKFGRGSCKKFGKQEASTNVPFLSVKRKKQLMKSIEGLSLGGWDCKLTQVFELHQPYPICLQNLE